MAPTPEPPYVAVIFTNRRATTDPPTAASTAADAAYAAAAARMEELAETVDGYLGIESARAADGTGITVSYWRDDAAVAAWRDHPEHLDTQARGRAEWYEWYELRVARVERARSWHASAEPPSAEAP